MLYKNIQILVGYDERLLNENPEKLEPYVMLNIFEHCRSQIRFS